MDDRNILVERINPALYAAMLDIGAAKSSLSS